MNRIYTDRRLAAFAILVLLQVLVIIGIVVREERIRATGLEVVLKAAPVDPRDLLRGDYVILQYDVQSIPAYKGLGLDRPGDEVYVVLEHVDRYWTVKEYRPASAGKPSSGAVFITGSIDSVDRDTVRVSFPNLDRYYVPQGTGNLPKPPDAIVIVDRDGNARIKRLEIDGKPWPEATPKP